ncbi:MAG: DUF2007 domain-containing protein [Burkholderiales bacterium]
MLRLCTTANLPEAHLLRDLLGQAGIEALVFNEHAQSALGEIPFTHASPELWVAEDRDLSRARDVVRAFRSAPAPRERRCAACGEANPATFDLCWSCGAELSQ